MNRNPDLVAEKEQLKTFLRDYRNKNGDLKYHEMMMEIQRGERRTVDISIDDVARVDEMLAKHIEKNTIRYVSLFADAIDNCPELPRPRPDGNDVFDVLLASRSRMEEQNQANGPDQPANLPNIPPELRRKYEVRIHARNMTKTLRVRNIQAKHVGSLVKVQGIVTRITDVRPLIKVATYICDLCGNEIYQIVNKKQYTPISECPSAECQRIRNKKPILPQTRGSKFRKFQEIKLQELPEEVPEGNVPRTITIYVTGDDTRQATCGDKIAVSGVWLPAPKTGFAAMRAGLTSNTYLSAMSISKEKKGYVVDHQSDALMREVDRMIRDPQIYSKLARSIAPEIYGLEDVKKALLLLLVAGVTKQQADGMKIRGDINVLLMGDPGVAKSQLLKHITTVAPRAVYTTGKGSSGVGLTAAVMRDPVTKDMVLEGGALVLSDMGICCIDEFDKMEDSDRTAIHEVMEQQTISIAKAGITTTLNARTAILSAANPAFGRYDKSRTPEQNINLPAALLSRFDLLFVMVDKPDIDNDIALARHIAHVHQTSKHPQLDFEPFSADVMRAYIARARENTPLVPRELTNYLIGCYVELRKASLNELGMYDSRKIVGTPRALLSILRLSQALARIRMANEVNQADVEEAIRLMQEAKRSTLSDDQQEQVGDTTSRIYGLILAHIQGRGAQRCRIAELKTTLTTRGFSEQEIQDTLRAYSDTDVWMVSNDGEVLELM